MGNRITKVYTRTGDGGDTGLGDGARVAKDDPRVETIGTVDELNCTLGMVLAHALSPLVHDCLQRVQHELFDLGGELSIPGRPAITDEHCTALERDIDRINEALPPLKEFILPSGGPAASACHLARATCRRAERRLVTLQSTQEVNPCSGVYLNRLSDLLFVAARQIARESGQPETCWKHDRH